MLAVPEGVFIGDLVKQVSKDRLTGKKRSGSKEVRFF